MTQTENPAVSIVMRNKNEGVVVRETLKSLDSQDYKGEVELIVIDSGSTDISLEIIKEYKPQLLHSILPEEYIPGKVLNWGMQHATHDWVIFLNSDATPQNDQWLRLLIEAGLSRANFGAAFCRQVARKNAKTAFRIDYDKCFSPQRVSHDWEHFFSMVGSLTHKKVWQVHPFDETIQYSEDEEWSRRLVKEGYDVLYAEDSVVIHSHNYTFKETVKRAAGEMKASLQFQQVKPNSLTFLKSVCAASVKNWLKDIPYHVKNGKMLELPRSLSIRFAQRYGKWQANNK
jgi:rhamnosyltransferase